MRISPLSMERDVLDLVQRLFGKALADGDVELIVSSRDQGGKIISMIAKKPLCAEISIFVEDGDPSIYLTVGYNTEFEITLRGSWNEDQKDVEDTIAIIEAVVAGRFEEILWKRQGRLVKSYGKLYVDSAQGCRVLDMPGSGPGWNPFKRGGMEEQDIRYRAWGVEIEPVNSD